MAAMAATCEAMLDAAGSAARSRSTTATTFARRRSRPASPTRSTFRASCRNTSGRCSAKARDRSAGRRSRAIPTTFASPTKRRSRCSRTTSALCRWIRLARERVAFQGLPARICWLGYGERARFGLRINELVRDGRAQGADRDRPRSSRHRLGGVAESRDRRDARRQRRDRRLAGAERAAERVGGATWVSVHHGGGVGIGYSLHAGMVIVADGTADADERLERVLTCDPGIGVAAPCRRRLSRGDRHGRARRLANPDA